MLRTDLKPISVAAQLAARGVSVDFNGAASAVIPAISLRSTAAAGAWVAEGGVIPVVKGPSPRRGSTASSSQESSR